MTPRLSRRGLLAAGAGLAGTVTLAACRSGSTSAASPSASPAYAGDLELVALSAALENLATTSYDSVLALAGLGKLGQVPPAVSTFLTSSRGHHAAHARAWNEILTDSGLPAVDTAAVTLAPTMATAVANATTVASALEILASLEQTLAETHLHAVGAIADDRAVVTAASVVPVEAMHSAVLGFFLGTGAAPDALLPTDRAVDVSTLLA